jgi:hypothetical protein
MGLLTLSYSLVLQALTVAGDLPLTGRSVSWVVRAVSGGRAGTTTRGAEDALLANNPAATWVKATGDSHGAQHTEGGPSRRESTTC